MIYFYLLVLEGGGRIRYDQEAHDIWQKLLEKEGLEPRIFAGDVTKNWWSRSGIPKNIIDKIFQAYFSTKKTGTGLGLPTAKRIIEDHKGTILVQSEEGKGTNFSIKLPINLTIN